VHIWAFGQLEEAIHTYIISALFEPFPKSLTIIMHSCFYFQCITSGNLIVWGMGCRGKPHVRRVVRKRQGCKQEVAYLGGIGTCSFGEIFCHHRTNLENLGSPPFVWALVISKNFASFWNPINMPLPASLCLWYAHLNDINMNNIIKIRKTII